MQSALAGESVTADHGGVSVTLNGNLEVTKLTIGDGMTKAQIEKAAQECFNDAVKHAQKPIAQKEMGGLKNFGL